MKSKKRDRFGNYIDPEVGYAYGEILKGSFEIRQRLIKGLNLIKQKIENKGIENVYNFCSHHRKLLINNVDLRTKTNEYWGEPLFREQLKDLAIQHLSGEKDQGAMVVNRTTAGIIATVKALVEVGDTVLSIAPNESTHASVRRGTQLAGAKFMEISKFNGSQNSIREEPISLVAITSCTSELDIINEKTLANSIEWSKKNNIPVLVDDAYGARVRPTFFNQPPALQEGADLVITNSDKAGLSGPRAGFLVGNSELVKEIDAKACIYGMEARPPLALGVMRSLENYKPKDCEMEGKAAEEIAKALSRKFGNEFVTTKPLWAVISEEDALSIILDRSKSDVKDPRIVPIEATTAVGMILLNEYGILTRNVHGMPGGRLSLRLGALPEELTKLGGAKLFAEYVDSAIQKVSENFTDMDWMYNIILGSNCP